MRFAQPGMGVTLNGIGEGYITDRVVELLRAGGIEHALVDMGETSARSAAHPAGGPWSVGLEDPALARHDRRAHSRSSTGRWRPPAATARCSIRPAASIIFSSRGAGAPVGAGFRFGRGGDSDRVERAVERFRVMPEEATAPIVRKLGLVAHFVRPDGARFVQRA